jgi:CTP synthase (UTP-ammonia lyase)
VSTKGVPIVVSIGVVGDYQPELATHIATTAALEHASEAAGLGVRLAWLATADIESRLDRVLESFDGLLVAPGSPYRSMEGALAAITFARNRNVPLLGTCGGFQHVAIELARRVLGIEDAQHAEYDPYASNLFITPLSCSLAGQQMTVEVRPGTTTAEAYGCPSTTERYYCNFGLNPEYLEALAGSGLVVSGVDKDGEARVIELPELRFFLATLFVPQTSSSPEHPHPLVAAFIEAANSRRSHEENGKTGQAMQY